ncbi:hypothetical protein K0M31_008785 [Melipona bicolor]|uniref:Uncharacterized protein n=1 Tax=Melipona bicolor TaxID=60889 RepID=A0AA40KKA0_9HYME|nr:hypothetical protein K0M31_008785 [Melipona bicolor]
MEEPTNTASGSNEDEDETPLDPVVVISNDKSTEFFLATVVEEAAVQTDLSEEEQPAKEKESNCIFRIRVARKEAWIFYIAYESIIHWRKELLVDTFDKNRNKTPINSVHCEIDSFVCGVSTGPASWSSNYID